MEDSNRLRDWIHGEVVEVSGDAIADRMFMVNKAVAVYEIEDSDGGRYIGSIWENICEWDSGLLRTAMEEMREYSADD